MKKREGIAAIMKGQLIPFVIVIHSEYEKRTRPAIHSPQPVLSCACLVDTRDRKPLLLFPFERNTIDSLKAQSFSHL
jgi:hypothetical protein